MAQRYNVNRATVKRWADDGLLPYFLTPSGQRRFEVADIESAIAGSASKSA